MYGAYNVPHKCIKLLTDDFNKVVEYENDTEEKRAERKQKLRDFAQVLSIQLAPKTVTWGQNVTQKLLGTLAQI